MKRIELAKDFSRYPAGRYNEDGPYSGQAFREKFLEPNIESEETITIVLDGARGYGSSFLEEAFGGLVRKGFSPDLVNSKINIVSKDPTLKMEIADYIKNAMNGVEDGV